MNDEYDHLLKEGEVLRPIDRSGWIITKKILAVGDEVIIAYSGRNFRVLPAVFDVPVRCRITALSDLMLNIGLELLTPAPGWSVGVLSGWFNVLWQIQGKVVPDHDSKVLDPWSSDAENCNRITGASEAVESTTNGSETDGVGMPVA